MSPLVEARGVTRVLPGEVPVTLVREIDLSIGTGEFMAITGPSGSGKSSLLYLLGLLDTPTAGEILYDGVPTASMTADERAEIRLAGIGFVFQFHFLLPEFSVIDNVMVPMRRLARLGHCRLPHPALRRRHLHRPQGAGDDVQSRRLAVRFPPFWS